MSFQIVPAAASASQNSDAASSSSSSSSSKETRAEWWETVAKSLKTLQPNRLLFLDVAAVSKSAPKASQQPLAVPVAAPRYSLWVLDVTPPTRAQDTRAAVLVLPQGRECEWQFRSLSGGSDLARAHGFHRVVFVALNRGQVFAGLEQVKTELTPLLRAFQPTAMSGSMQIVSLGSDVGARREVHRVEPTAKDAITAAAGALVVEDVLVDDAHVHRRLLFEGSGLVQSEARLNVPASYLTMTAAQRKARMKKKKQKKKQAGGAAAAGGEGEKKEEEDEVDADEEPPTAASSSSSAASSNLPLSCTPSPSASLISYSYLPCEYQHGLLTMLALLPSPVQRMILVGLGGGSLTMFLSLTQPQLEVTVVELEQQVVDSAHRFFGFQENRPRLTCHVADGLKVVEEVARRIEGGAAAETSIEKLTLSSVSSAPTLPSTPQDVVLIDVNNVDLGEGLSFPPPAFLEPAFLEKVKVCLRKEGHGDQKGWLMVNLGCRNLPLRDQLLSQLAHSFRRVYLLQPDEAYVNYILAATESDLAETELEWEEAERRLKRVQNPLATATDSSVKPLAWDASLISDCHDALKRVQRLQLHAKDGTVELKYLFAKQRAEQEAEENA